MADLTNLKCALFPKTAHKMLVGRRVGMDGPDLADFNAHAAGCSYSFFFSHRTGFDLDTLFATIGQRTQESLEEAIGSAFRAFRKEHSIERRTPDGEPPVSEEDAVRRDIIVDPAHKLTTYPLSFNGIADKQTAHRIAAILKVIVIELQRLMPLDRLDGFTFAADYEAALRDLDRGFEASEPLKTANSTYGVSVAMTPLVMRDDLLPGIPSS